MKAKLLSLNFGMCGEHQSGGCCGEQWYIFSKDEEEDKGGGSVGVYYTLHELFLPSKDS